MEGFYGNQADHRFSEAWALADPSFRAQLQGYDAFVSQSETLQSLTFRRAEVTERSSRQAVVAVATTAVHTDRVDHCAGTATVVPAGSSGWLVDHISISCSP